MSKHRHRAVSLTRRYCGDALFYGDVDIGSTEFAPLLTTSYQKAYGNIYSTPSDVYSTTYVNGIETLLPSDTPLATLYANNVLPELALFDSTTPVVPQSPELTALLSVPHSGWRLRVDPPPDP